MRKGAHHREVQLSNYHVELKPYLGSCICAGFSSECQATRFLKRIFFIPLRIHFWCVSDVALHWNKCLTTIKLTKKWLTSPIEAFHAEKSPKRGKRFCRGNFSLCPEENILLASAAKKYPKNIPAKFQDCAIFAPGVFFFPKEGHSTMMDRQTFFFPKSFLCRPPENHLLLLWIYGMPTRFDGD